MRIDSSSIAHLIPESVSMCRPRTSPFLSGITDEEIFRSHEIERKKAGEIEDSSFVYKSAYYAL